MVHGQNEHLTLDDAEGDVASRWWLAINLERCRPSETISWGDLDRRYRNDSRGNKSHFNRAQAKFKRVGADIAFQCGEILAQLQQERGFEPRWNGLLSLAAVPHRSHTLGVVGTIMCHWDRQAEQASRRQCSERASVWNVLHDPDVMDGGRMLTRALALVAATAVDLYSWEGVAGDAFFEERVVLAKYSKVINAAWREWRHATRDDDFASVPEQYEAACRLLKRPRDADDAPLLHIRLAQLALCEAYNFGADSKTDLVPNFYASCLSRSHDLLEEFGQAEHDALFGPLAIRREKATPQWARIAREFTRT